MSEQKRKRIILAVTTDLTYDQRLHRVAGTLQDAGYDVLVVARRWKGSLPLPERTYRTRRMRLLFRRGAAFYAEFNIRLFLTLLFARFDVVTANDLDTLMGCSWAARLRGKKLAFDAHEWYTHVPELMNRERTRKQWERIESKHVPRAALFYTVNESLADIFSRQFGRKVFVVRNLPLRQPTPPVKKEPGNILIYQGALNAARGIDLMMKALEHLPGFELWICGFGSDEINLRAIATSLPWRDRIHFKGLIPFEQLPLVTRNATAGFSLEESRSENYRLALPNKLFDYIQAGVPVIVSDLPEMARVVRQYRTGIALGENERTPERIAAAVQQLISHPESWAEFQENCRRAAQELCWEKESEKLVQAYRSLLPA